MQMMCEINSLKQCQYYHDQLQVKKTELHTGRGDKQAASNVSCKQEADMLVSDTGWRFIAGNVLSAPWTASDFADRYKNTDVHTWGTLRIK